MENDQQISNQGKRSLSDNDTLEDESLPKRPNNAEASNQSIGSLMPKSDENSAQSRSSRTSLPCNDSPQPAARVVAGHTTQSAGDFKLHAVLPKQITPEKHEQLETACKEFCNHISKMLPTSPFEGQLNELDLTLPSSYADLFNNNSQFLYQLLTQPIKKYPKSKVIIFPEMKLEIMSDLIHKLQDVITSAAYDIVCLSFSSRLSHGDSTSICNVLKSFHREPTHEINIKIESLDTANLKKEIKKDFGTKKDVTKKDVTKKDVTIKINDEVVVKCAAQPKQVEKKPKAKAKKKEKLTLPPISDSSTPMFSYDSYLLSPVINQALPFTAYNYWRLDEAHNNGFTGKGIKVAVIDTGIVDHPAFKTTILLPIMTQCPTNVCNDLVGHGTFCAGIICGKGYPTGVAPDAQLKVCKVTRHNSSVASTDDTVEALKLIAADDIDVVNISMGSLAFSPEMAKAISALVDKGVIVVCAASNHGHKFSQSVCFPARLGNVLCIGSHGPHGKPSDFSPVGQEIDFLAPGENVTGPSNREYLNDVAIESGTSYAAPAVAGLVCLILQYIKENATLQQLIFLKNHWVMKEVLRKMSTSPGRHSDDRGFGALNPSVFFRNPNQFLISTFQELYKQDESIYMY